MYIEENNETEYENYDNFNFTMIPNEFVFARFDSNTVNYFLLITACAQSNSRESREFQKTISNNTAIHVKQFQYCENLLIFCNIIEIETIYNPANSNVILKKRITILEKEKWNLNHTFRNAEQFYKEHK